MASLKRYEREDGTTDYWRIQVSRGSGLSPASMRWRPPDGALWSRRTEEREANKAAAAFELEVKNGTWKPRAERKAIEEEERRRKEARLTVGQFVKQVFLPFKKGRITDASFVSLTNRTKHLAPIEDILLEELTPATLQRFVDDDWEDTATARTSKIKYHQTLREILKMAVRLDVLAADPSDKVDWPKLNKNDKAELIKRRESKWLNDEDVRALLAAADQMADVMKRALIYVLVDTGCRIGEIVALKWSCFSEDPPTLRIADTLTRSKGQRKLQAPKTLAALRTIRIWPETRDVLSELHRARPETEWIFQGRKNNMPIDYGTAKNAIESACEAAEIRVVSPHSLRHTAASRAVSHGANLEGVRRRMGHSSITTTMGFYVHSDQEASDSVGERMRSGLFDTESKT